MSETGKVIVANAEWLEYCRQLGIKEPKPGQDFEEAPKPFVKNRALWIGLGIVTLLALILFGSRPRRPRVDMKQQARQMIEAEGRGELEGRKVLSEEDLAKLAGPPNSVGTEVSPPAPVEELAELRPGSTDQSGKMGIFVQGEGGSFGALGIPAGTEIRAVIQQSVVSSSLEVPVVATIRREFSRDAKVLIPAGSKLLGRSGEIHSENRLHIQFYRLVTPEGKEFPFSGIALAPNGSAGLIGKVHRKPGTRGGSVAASAALGATGVFLPRGMNFGDTFGRGAHAGAASEVQRDLNHYRQTEGNPTIEVPPDQEVIVVVDRTI